MLRESEMRSFSEDIFDEVRAERTRAHAKHGDTSMESSGPDTLRRLAILSEEVGEVAREFNDAEHDGRSVDLVKLRKELIQVAAMAGAWADACGAAPVRKITVHFQGGPWNGTTYEVERVIGPLFAVGHEIGNHYWLDSKSDPPTYFWNPDA